MRFGKPRPSGRGGGHCCSRRRFARTPRRASGGRRTGRRRTAARGSARRPGKRRRPRSGRPRRSGSAPWPCSGGAGRPATALRRNRWSLGRRGSRTRESTPLPSPRCGRSAGGRLPRRPGRPPRPLRNRPPRRWRRVRWADGPVALNCRSTTILLSFGPARPPGVRITHRRGPRQTCTRRAPDGKFVTPLCPDSVRRGGRRRSDRVASQAT